MKKFFKFIKDAWKGDFEYPEGIYDNSPFWDDVKHTMCGNNIFGNFFYLLWGDLDCPCCAFFRGMIIGVVATLGIGYITG